MKFRVFLLYFALLAAPYSGVATPFIQSFWPLVGSSNDMNSIEIYGSGFYPNLQSVKFNNVESFPAAWAHDATWITAHVAPGTPLGPTRIVVTVGGVPTQSGNFFVVVGPGPVVTNFTPVFGSDSTRVTIQGVHFVNSNPSLAVTNVSFNGRTAAIVSQDDNTLVVDAPAGVTTGPIIVRSSLGAFSTLTNILSPATNFFVSPRITGFSPSAGRPYTNVVLTGSNFLYASSVTFGSVPANFTPPTNNSTLVAFVPVGASTAPITVFTPAPNPFTTSSNFVVQPTVSGFTPGAGPVRTSITVTGANFNVGTPTVKFGGVTAPTPTNISFGSLQVGVPINATNAPVTVTTTEGSMTSTQLFYLPPMISSFTPTNSPPGSRVTLTGQNFLGATAVTFMGTSPVFPSVTNNTTLGVTVPGGVITGPISLTTPAGTTNSTQWFYGAPVINSFNPTHGSPGANVSIFGTNFYSAQYVRFNGVNASPITILNNGGRIDTTVPATATTGPITVIGPAGTNTSAGVFTLDASDLAVTVTGSPDPVFIGSSLVYTITVANNGPFSVPTVMLTNTLPASAQLYAATTTQGSLNTNGNPVVGSLGTINSGGAAVVTLTVVPRAAGTITNTALAFGGFSDTLPSNNTNSISTTVLPLPSISIAAWTNQVQVYWPGPLSNFTLQFKTALNPTYFWSNDPTTPIFSNGSNVVVEPITNSSRFYRLKL